mgnify:CR=1 FL=1
MTMIQFGNFCHNTHQANNHLNSSAIDRIFLRAVRLLPPVSTDSGSDGSTDATSSLASALPSTGIKVSKDWKKVKAALSIVGLIGKGANVMTQAQFVGALIRLASARYPEAGLSIAEKLSRLVKEQVEHHVLNELRLIDDEFGARMRTRAMGAVLNRYGAQLKHIFTAYSAADQSSSIAARHALATMNVIELNELCEDVEILDTTYTVRDMLAAFVKVNIDDVRAGPEM